MAKLKPLKPNFVRNPVTNRPVKVGSKTHKKIKPQVEVKEDIKTDVKTDVKAPKRKQGGNIYKRLWSGELQKAESGLIKNHLQMKNGKLRLNREGMNFLKSKRKK